MKKSRQSFSKTIFQSVAFPGKENQSEEEMKNLHDLSFDAQQWETGSKHVLHTCRIYVVSASFLSEK